MHLKQRDAFIVKNYVNTDSTVGLSILSQIEHAPHDGLLNGA